MDTGPVFQKKEVAVAPDDDALTLEKKLVGAGLQALGACLDAIARGDIRRTPQAGEASLAPMLEKTHGAVAFDRPALEVHNQVRALCRWPVAYRETVREGKPLRFAIHKTLPPGPAEAAWKQPPGTVVSIEKGRGILVQCSPGRIWIRTVQPEGRKPMEATDFANGLRLRVGDIL